MDRTPLSTDDQDRRKRKDRMEDSRHLQKAIQLLEGLSKGSKGLALDLNSLILEGIQVLEARIGFFRCSFVVPARLADKDRNWEVGAIATLIDNMCSLAIYSFNGQDNVTANFNISFLSTAKIHEEVEIEAKVTGKRGRRFIFALVEIRRKDNRQIIALAKQWMVSKL